MNKKTLLLAVVLLLVLNIASAITISDISSIPTEDSITISWVTDVETNSSVLYGAITLENKTKDGELKLSHQAILSELQSGKEYNYVITACNATDCAQSEMMTETTLNSQGNYTGEFFIDVNHDGEEVPQYFNNPKISLEIKSVPGTILKGFVNGELKRYIASLDEDGIASFNNMELRADAVPNIIKIEATSTDGEIITKEFEITLDTIPPNAEIDDLPEISLDQVINLNGSTDEDITVEVYMALGDDEEVLAQASDFPVGSFILPISFPSGDGDYNVRIVLKDKGGNEIVKEKQVSIDTTDPAITAPTNLERYSPSYVNKVRISGKTEPNAMVVVYVNGATSAKKSWEASIKGTFFTILRQLNFGNLTILDEEGIGKNWDYVTQADDEGNFVIDVLLSQKVLVDEYQGQRNTRHGVPGVNVTTREFTTVPAWKNDITIIAVDKVGRVSANPVTGTIIYTTCDFGGDWQVTIDQVTPNVIQPRHIMEGIASFGFNYRLKWQGPGDEMQAHIIGNRPEISVPGTNVMSQYAEDEGEYKLGALVTRTARINNYFQEGMNLGTVKVDLVRYPTQEEDIENYDTLKIMLQMDIRYTYDHFGQKGQGLQKKCIPVSIALDKRLDEADIPEKFLNTSINVLNTTVKTLTDVKEVVDDIRDYLFIASIATNVYYYGNVVNQKLKCKDFWGSNFLPLKKDDGKKRVVDVGCNDNDNLEDKQDYKSNCDECVKAIEKTEKSKVINHWVSDRIFCPAIPNVRVYSKDVDNQQYWFYKAEGDDKAELHDENPCSPDHIDAKNEECKSMYKSEWVSACPGVKDIYAHSFEKDNLSFFDRLGDTINNVCKDKQYEENVRLMKNNCCPINTGLEKNSQGNPIVAENYVEKTIDGEKKWVPSGYKTCYYIINPKSINKKGVYLATDVDFNSACLKKEGSTECERVGDTDDIIFDSSKIIKTISLDESLPYYIVDTGDEDTEEPLGDNYVKLKFDNDPAKSKKIAEQCFNSMLDDESEKYVIDPTSGFLRSVQCVCVPAISQYLNNYKNMATAVKQCFETIVLTGETSSGMCKAVLTQYVCDLVYDVIRCGGKFFASQQKKILSSQKRDDGLTGFFAAMNNAGDSVTQSVQNRYGATSMYQWLFSERTLVHSACLGAFTGDWDVQLNTLMDTASRQIPVKSNVFIWPATRRFMSSDPFTGRANYIYHVGVGIVAGADLSYKVYLLCSNGMDCDTETGMCDCAVGDAIEKVGNMGVSGNLKNGDMFSKDIYKNLDGASVRYDKVVVWYTYRNNQGETVVEKVEQPIREIGGSPPSCKFDVLSAQFLCNFDIGERGFVSFGGTVPRFARQSGQLDTTFKINERIIVDGQIIKRSPDSEHPKNAYLMMKVKNANGDYMSLGEQHFRLTQDGTFDLRDLFQNQINLRVDEDWMSSAEQSQVYKAFDGVQAVVYGSLPQEVKIKFEKVNEGKYTMSVEIEPDSNDKTNYRDGCGIEDPQKQGKLECDYDGSKTLRIGNAEIRIRGTPTQIQNGNPEQQTDWLIIDQRTNTMNRNFVLELSLHYESSNGGVDPSPVLIGTSEQDYPLPFTVTNEYSEHNRCKLDSASHSIVPDDECNCIVDRDSDSLNICPKGSLHVYCYYGKCLDRQSCIQWETINKNTPSYSDVQIKGSDDCYCDPFATSPDWPDTNNYPQNGNGKYYCYSNSTGDGIRIHETPPSSANLTYTMGLFK